MTDYEKLQKQALEVGHSPHAGGLRYQSFSRSAQDTTGHLLTFLTLTI